MANAVKSLSCGTLNVTAGQIADKLGIKKTTVQVDVSKRFNGNYEAYLESKGIHGADDFDSYGSGIIGEDSTIEAVDDDPIEGTSAIDEIMDIIGYDTDFVEVVTDVPEPAPAAPATPQGMLSKVNMIIRALNDLSADLEDRQEAEGVRDLAGQMCYALNEMRIDLYGCFIDWDAIAQAHGV